MVLVLAVFWVFSVHLFEFEVFWLLVILKAATFVVSVCMPFLLLFNIYLFHIICIFSHTPLWYAVGISLLSLHGYVGENCCTVQDVKFAFRCSTFSSVWHLCTGHDCRNWHCSVVKLGRHPVTCCVEQKPVNKINTLPTASEWQMWILCHYHNTASERQIIWQNI